MRRATGVADRGGQAADGGRGRPARPPAGPARRARPSWRRWTPTSALFDPDARRPAPGAQVPVQHPGAPAAAPPPAHRRRRGAAAWRPCTLEKMAAGACTIRSAAAFTATRPTSAGWCPHFEKMLYDNALLAVAYAEAWQVTRRPDFARVLRETLDYVLREMTSPEGGFYSATDADSEGEEGKFFVWSRGGDPASCWAPRPSASCATTTSPPAGNFEGHNILQRRPGPTRPSTRRWPPRAPDAVRGARPARRPRCATTRSWRPGTA